MIEKNPTTELHPHISKEKEKGHFLPLWNMDFYPAPGDVCVPGVPMLNLMPAPEQQVTMHTLEERWLLSLRRSLPWQLKGFGLASEADFIS